MYAVDYGYEAAPKELLGPPISLFRLEATSDAGASTLQRLSCRRSCLCDPESTISLDNAR